MSETSDGADPADAPRTGPRRPPVAPPDVLALAHARRDARAAQDWAEADRLKLAIEAAGWKVVDRGVDFALAPIVPADVERDGRTWYGSASSVPSLLDEPDAVELTVLVPCGGGSDRDVEECLALARAALDATAGAQVVALVPEAAGSFPGDVPDGVELVPILGDPAPGELLEAGSRRASGRTLVVVTPGAAADGPQTGALRDALVDPSVAIVGTVGARTDLRRLERVGHGDADVLLPGLIAFRRSDVAGRELFDRRLRTWEGTVEWLTLALREPLEDRGPVRRAVVVGDGGAMPDATRDPGARRDFYRLLDRFGWSEGLLSLRG